LAAVADRLPEWLLVASVTVREGPVIAAEARRTNGQKCLRCWRYVDVLNDEGVCERCQAVLATISRT
jgi:isoleucyl-tRNA synthetase